MKEVFWEFGNGFFLRNGARRRELRVIEQKPAKRRPFRNFEIFKRHLLRVYGLKLVEIDYRGW